MTLEPDTAKDCVQRLKQEEGCDIVIALTHTTLHIDKVLAREVSSRVNGWREARGRERRNRENLMEKVRKKKEGFR